MTDLHREAPALVGQGAGASEAVQLGGPDGFEHSGPSLALQREAERLHRRGPRPLGELLAEILDGLDAHEAEHLRERIRRYNSVPPELYRAFGADHFPQPPVHSVGGA